MAPTLDPEQQAINKEVRGFTYREFAWFIGAIMTVEATVLGMWFSTQSKISQVAQKTEAHDVRLNAQDGQLTGIRLDVDVLKIHDAKTDALLESVQNSKYARP